MALRLGCQNALRLLCSRGPGRPLQGAPAARHWASSASSTTDSTMHYPPAPRGALDEEHEEVNLYEKNPDFHGFSDDPHVDVWNMRATFFLGISVCIVLGSVYAHYLPDRGLRGWARREAEKKIKAREAQGLPLINVNYYEPSTIILPAEDE